MLTQAVNGIGIFPFNQEGRAALLVMTDNRKEYARLCYHRV